MKREGRYGYRWQDMVRLSAVFVIVFLVYGVIMKRLDPGWVEELEATGVESLGRNEVESLQMGGSALRDLRNPLPLTSSKRSTKDIPTQLYNMAKPVFNKLPERFLPEYKSSCWMFQEGRASPVLRCLPYFYIIGMPKCGTTTLWDDIVQHPHIHDDVPKEVHWWTRKRFLPMKKTFGWYLDGRSGTMVKKMKNHPELKSQLILGDATVSHMWDNHNLKQKSAWGKKGPDYVIADVIHAVQPDAKIIVSLREPVSRLYSEYLFSFAHPSNTRFDMLVREEIAYYQKCVKTASPRTCIYSRYGGLTGAGHGVRPLLGWYALFLEEWFRLYPREQFFILRLEDFYSNCTGILPQIYEFLEVVALPAEDIEAACSRAPMKQKQQRYTAAGEVLPKTRTFLENFYAEYNRELSKLLGDDRYLWQQ